MISNKLRKYTDLPVQAKASIWALICGVLSKGVSVITTPIFARILTTDEYGQYNVFISWMSILTVLVSFNLCAGVYAQGLVKFEERKKEFSSVMQGLTLTLMVFWTIVYLAFYKFWNGVFCLSTVQMLAMLFLIWLGAVFGLWSYEQKNDYKYKALVIVTLLVSILSPTLSVVLIKLSEDKVTARIIGVLIVEAVFFTGLFFAQLKNGKVFYDGKLWEYALLFNLPLVPHYLSQVVLASSDRIMIERMVGESEAGIYSLAYSLSMVMLIINNALMQTLSPWFYRKIKEKKNEDLAPVAYSTLVVVAVVNVILIVFAPEVVKIFAPKEYYDAIWVIPPVAISVFYIYGYDLFAKFAFYFEKQGFITIASTIGAGLNILLNYICIKRFGYMAAGYTTLMCYIIYVFCHYRFMNRVCDTYCDGNHPYNGKIIVLISAIFTAFGLLMLLTYNHIILRYSIIVVLLIVCLIMRTKIMAFWKKINIICTNNPPHPPERR